MSWQNCHDDDVWYERSSGAIKKRKTRNESRAGTAEVIGPMGKLTHDA